MTGKRRFVGIALVMLLLPWGSFVRFPQPQGEEPDPEVEAILDQMGPEDRVGQLFLVTFFGADVGPESDIAWLVTQYRVGGVMLLPQNDNFTDQEDLLAQVYQMTADLQMLAADTGAVSESESETEPAPVTITPPPPYIPLFIGIEHGGSISEYAPLLSGITPLPSNMAIGATWDPTLAEATGQIVGKGMSTLGINLLIGPPADVVEIPQPSTLGDLGPRVFGGEPFWVSQMTVSYVRGVHLGSSSRIAVVPRHFPGHGGADRIASVEVPTVRRSLDQLTQIDLQPFFAVTGNATDPAEVADGLLTGHIRYQGFQGDNPRLLTRPISLDPQAMQALLRLDPIASWHDEGGLVVSDALGLRGVRRFYDPQEANFPNRRIAQDAFLAGNDLLYLGNFGTNPPVDQTETVINTIEFFVQAYKEDPNFQARVDESVRRIIRKKLDLYGGRFTVDAVVPPSAALEDLVSQREVTFTVAQNSLTLLSPNQADLLTSPQSGESIVIFTDTRAVRQCSLCEPRPLIDINALQSAILRSYGPAGSGLVSRNTIRSFSFEVLDDWLEFGPRPETPSDNTGEAADTGETAEAGEDGIGGTAEADATGIVDEVGEATPEPDEIYTALVSADWIVFVMLDFNSEVPSSSVVKRFLAASPVSTDTQIVVMSMAAPYYLDSTEVGKLAAYYALYGYSDPFVDIAARALFQGVPLNGASPVSVSAINYDILEVTSPDPNQVIPLSVSLEQPAVESMPTPPADQVLEVRLGDTLFLTAGVITDQNGHPVPDGTPVEFVFNYVGQGLRDTAPVTTVDGIARIQQVLDRPGNLEITVQSGLAQTSVAYEFTIPEDPAEQGVGGRITPTIPSTTQTPAPTIETPVTPTFSAFTPSPTPELPQEPPQKNVTFGDLFLSLFGLIGLGGIIFIVGMFRRDVNYGLLLALPSLGFGLFSYNYYAMLLPGAEKWQGLFGDLSAGVAAWFGTLVGLGLTLLALYAWSNWIPLRGRNSR